MSRIRGLELLFSLSKNQLQSKEDCIVAALHCLLINESLQCVGIGEEFSDEDKRTELLPNNWNQNQEVYTLRYISKDGKNKFLIKIVKAGHILHVNIVLNEDKTAAMSVNVSKHVSDDYSDYDTAYLDLDSLSATFRRDILEELAPSPPKESAAKADKSKSQSPPIDPLAVPRPSRPIVNFDDRFDDHFDGRSPFPNVGGRDLDPLGRGSGGMIMDPFDFGRRNRPNQPPFGLPRGAVPPGARFDPFGPNVPGPNRGRPNPDHFRRPDDFDDFM